MFAKSKVSQSMIDAVNKVLGEQPVEQKDQLLNEAGTPIKEPYLNHLNFLEQDTQTVI